MTVREMILDYVKRNPNAKPTALAVALITAALVAS